MLNVGVVGASGYTGLELIKMLVTHPEFNLNYLATTSGQTRADELHSSLEGVCSLEVVEADVKSVIASCDLVFLALPHKASMSFAKDILDAGIKVVDLSADYRLEKETYEANYCEHTDVEHLEESVYGLIEYYRDEIKNTKLVASPGCYPTATLLGLLPFVKYIDDSSPIFVDAKSGISGAGKKLNETTTYVNMNDNIMAYNPLKHRHAPEIAEKISKICDVNIDVNFVPHLIPATRGELVSVYATLKDGMEDPIAILKEHYKNDEFIRIKETPVDIKSASGTHFCDIFATTHNNTLFISSAIDNLLRGASSQALAAANLMCGFNENLGVPKIAYMP